MLDTDPDGVQRAVPPAVGLDRTFAARPESVGAARGMVTTWLRSSMRDEHLLIADVALAVSEACTNVVIHAYPSANDHDVFRVVAEADGEAVVVTVSDEGRGIAPRPDSPGAGLGLPLIASTSDSFELRPPLGGRGTVVAMRFSAAGADARATARRRTAA